MDNRLTRFGLPFDRRLEEALLALYSTLESAESRRGYEAEWRRWSAWCAEKNVSPGAVDTVHVQQYLVGMQERGLAKATRARALAVIRRVYGEFVRCGILKINPAREATSIRESSEPRTPWLKEEELQAMLQRPARFTSWREERDWLILATLVGTGLRRQEVARLDRSLFVKTPRGLAVKVRAKGNKEGVITLPKWLERYFQTWRTHSPWVFPSTEFSMQPLTGASILNIVKRAAEKAGIPKERATAHAIRRSFVTLALMRGVAIEDLQRALLHSSKTITERYAKAAPPTIAPGEALGDLVIENPWKRR